MRVGFAGTPAFAAAALEAIAAAGFDIPLVLTRPDRPRGRGLALQPPEVKVVAGRLGLPTVQPTSVKPPDVQAQLFSTRLDVLIVAAYGLILPPAVLAWPRHGALNIHASLLPRWRGAAPVQRAILAGDAQTGITIMQMDAGLDTGPIVDVARVAIGPRDTAGALLGTLTAVGATLMVEVLQRLQRDGALSSTAQPADGATYAGKVERGEAMIDWREDAASVDRRIRAFDPTPGAHTCLREQTWKIWSAEPHGANGGAQPGEVIEVDAQAITVACGRDVLRIRELQPAGSKRLSASAIANGRRLVRGDVFAACG